MALFGAQTPREIQALPPQSLELVVTDDDASAIAAVKALIPGTAAVDNFVVQFANGSTARVKWGAFTEAEHAFVRVFREPAAPRLRFEVRCGGAAPPACLGRFANGQLEAWLRRARPAPLHAPAPRAARRVAFCHNDAAKRVLLRGDDLDAAFCGLERAGPNYAALDLAHYANADAAKPPGLDDRPPSSSRLAALHGRRPALGDVSALLSDVCFFTVVDNYRRGFAALAAAASGPAHEAAGLVLEAQARLQHARAQQYVLVW
ncbi:hypothetical protein JL721_4784 [Aureococcus anophagefferens]|nr:hypothetical protein JL721_4784 [Aureococcus anophagefferens]